LGVAGGGWAIGAVVLLACVLYVLRVYPLVGAGYRAKVLCSALFGSGRDLDTHLRTQISADAYLILRPFRVHVDRTARSVSASFFGLLSRTAVYRDGLGATLLAGPHLVTLGPPVPQRTPVVSSAPAWPRGHGSGALQDVVDAAFLEPQPQRLRRTYAVLVVRDGEIVAERYACGIRPEMPMPGWSMAKSVLNALVGILVAEGRLRLDQRELLREWPASDPRGAITLEDLLRMRSGLRFREQYGNPWSDVLRMLYRSHDMAACAAAMPLIAAPGTAWQYSSGTTNILSKVVRGVVGDAEYHGWPRRALFGRIGMSSATPEPDPSGTFVFSSYMLATARDWARFGQLFLDRGRWKGDQILPEEWIDFSTTPTVQCPEGRHGAHWWVKLNPEIGGDSPAARRIAADAFFAIGHEGQTLSVIPSKRLVVVRLGAAIYIDAWNHAQFIADVQDAV